MFRCKAAVLAVALVGCASAGSAGDRGDRNVILRPEIEASSVNNVLELVQSRRPNWRRVRGTQSFREQGEVIAYDERSGTSTPGAVRIVAYLNNARLGSVTELRGVMVWDVMYVRFFDAAAATQRWGGGHMHGAILVSTTEP
jgi:hypothetical protein